MSIGKDSIQKRVAKETPAVVEKKAPAKAEAKAPAAPPKAPAKKATTTAATKKPAAKKPTTTSAKKPTTTVMGNVSPEVVKKVTGKAENTKAAFPRFALTEDLPYYLL